MSNFWDEHIDEPSELDMLEASYEEEEPEEHQYYEEDDIADEVLEEIIENSAFDLDTKESVVVYNARVRLEQAKLYEMLINHNLFDGVDASPQAIENVQNELKSYITERLEILLGMKKEKQAPQEQVVAVDSPFNDVEVDFLKALAYKGTKGESATGQPLQTEVRTGIKPLTGKPKPKLKSLAEKQPPKPVVREEVVEEEPLVQQPVKRKKVARKKATKKKVARKKVAKKKEKSVQSQIKSGGVMKKRNLTPSEIEALAMEEIRREQEIAKDANWKKLSAEEKARRIAEKNAGQVKAKPTTARDMPSQDQINAHYTMQQQSQSMSSNQHTKFNNMIASAMAMQKSKE